VRQLSIPNFGGEETKTPPLTIKTISRQALINKGSLAWNERKYTMNSTLRTDPLIKLFNQSVGRLCRRNTKSLVLASFLVGAMVAMLSAPVQGAAPSSSERDGQPADTFSILLEGPYTPVVHGPDLGLTTVNLSDGSFSTTKIFAVSGLPEDVIGHGNGHTKKAIGNFYVQFAGSSVAYDLPEGAIAMVFTGSNTQNVPDGQGGTYIVGTFELNITEANGIYQSFVGGHNTMVDVLHQLADGSFVERCICIISRKV
jgi:hypothetical protein